MQVELLSWSQKNGWDKKSALTNAGLVIYFAGKAIAEADKQRQQLQGFYPQAHVLGCSTGGEICGPEVMDGSMVAAAVHLSKTPIRTASTYVTNAAESLSAGQKLATALHAPDLRYIFLLSDGVNVNGSDLVRGIYDVVDEQVIVTGGLAGDGADFKHTLVSLDGAPKEKLIAAVGFYGDAIQIGYGSVGGWNPFGPERQITKSRGNILYELDGRPALDLYKEYLGEDAANLPGSALFFPLSIKPAQQSEHNMVRTALGIDEKEKTMTFAGDVPEGYTAQLMRGDFNNLVDGAIQAAALASSTLPNNALALLVSCIGRKLLLGQSISDETEAVADVFEYKIPTIGFYSYGEICHQQFTGKCSLHNQTMTVTVLHEK